MLILRPLTVAALAALLAACSSGGLLRPTADDDTLEQVDTLLDEAAYTTQVDCLSRSSYDSVEVLDGTRLLFHGRAGRLWLNQLGVCSGLRRHVTLQFDVRGSRLCRLDTVREYDPWFFGGQAGAACSLGAFEEIPAEQAALLSDLLGR